jgi:hypothetical protein
VPMQWANPASLRLGQYYASAEVYEPVHTFPPVPRGNVLIERKMVHHFANRIPIFRIT